MVILTKELLEFEEFPKLSEAQEEALPSINYNIELLAYRTGEEYDIELDEFYLVVNRDDENKEERIVWSTNDLLELDDYLKSVNRILSKTLNNIVNLIKRRS